MSILSVKNLSKSFGKLEVLNDISFNVEQGEVISIIGPSGSGKSTLLRCINQFEKIDSGECEICGITMTCLLYTSFSLVTDGGFFGFAFILCLVAVAASCYIPQLKPFRKIISAIGSVAGIVCLFIAPGSAASAVNAAAGGATAGTGVSAKVELNYLIGFWIILILMLALIAMSVIQFLGLKGNKVFDAVNSAEDENGTAGRCV